MSVSRKYYWLKLKRDFFKRHDITIIEDMPNGKDYILFYLKLLVESIDHNGELRFSDTIPYSPEMLASLTRTNIDTVRSAVKLFAELEMMERLDDGTLYMRQIENMIGHETADAERMRLKRSRGQLSLPQENKDENKDANVDEHCSPEFENRSPEYRDRDRDRDKETEREEDSGGRSKPKAQKHKYGSQSNVLLTDEEKNRLVAELGDEVFTDCVEYLSSYKVETGRVSKNDNLTIRRWVIDAVKEKKARANGQAIGRRSGYPSVPVPSYPNREPASEETKRAAAAALSDPDLF